MNVYESAENYLETILRLKGKNGTVRAVDIASELGFSKPSVSIALKKLRENGYVDVNSDGLITLLPEGKTVAERIYERHRFLTELFIKVGVGEETAVSDACQIEHHLSEETFTRLKEFIAKLEQQNLI